MPSNYDRIGGARVLTAVVADHYRRVLADPTLAHFFTDVDLVRVQRRQVEFFAAVLGGPVRYTGSPMRRVHRGLGITRRHFDRVVHHLTESLAAASVPADLTAVILAALAPLAGDIVDRRVTRGTPRGSGSRIWVWSSVFGSTA